MRHLNAQDLADMPTLCVGQCCSLKIDQPYTRVWLCRVAGGVTIERFNGSQWHTSVGGCYSTDTEVCS